MLLKISKFKSLGLHPHNMDMILMYKLRPVKIPFPATKNDGRTEVVFYGTGIFCKEKIRKENLKMCLSLSFHNDKIISPNLFSSSNLIS